MGMRSGGGPLAPPKPLTQMTIAEVLAYQREMKPRAGSPAFPVGRAQWTESTLRGLTRGMDPNTVFSPEVQEKLFDRSIAGRMGQGPGGFRSEWDSLRAVPDGEIDRAIAGAPRCAEERRSGTVASAGPKGAYPDWMDDRSKREMAGINAPLARDLIAASEETGTHFRILQGMRSEAEAAHNAMTGRGVVNSQHRWGAAADIKLTDAEDTTSADRPMRTSRRRSRHIRRPRAATAGGSAVSAAGGRRTSRTSTRASAMVRRTLATPTVRAARLRPTSQPATWRSSPGSDNPFLRAAKPLSEAADKLKAVVAPMPAVAPEPPRQPAMEHRVADGSAARPHDAH